ncbi:mannonate dehydratase [Lentisphaerota bacterium WC36G]|nr:mannonate dehydratase [Lentisphaerae bacterium WC36]
MTETFRWYGPTDVVTLTDIRQAGCKGVINAIHEIPYGEVWTRADIKKRKDLIESANLKWSAVESVPVSEDIKTHSGNYKRHIENYKETVRNLGAEGIEIIIYNFMPVLDWVRTDLTYKLESGAECLLFNPVEFAAFEIYILKRIGAENDYTAEQLKKAEEFFNSLSDEGKKSFERDIIDVFPGCKMNFSIEDIRQMLAKYDDIDRAQLTENYRYFLNEIIPVCEEAGVRMAVHPDDPPFSILGLPRIVSCEEDVKNIINMYDSPANGLCFCTGSFSPREDNDLPAMIKRYGNRINVAHLRSTQRNADGSFYEAAHLEGSVDMYEVVKALLEEQQRRKDEDRDDWQLPFRPDHGHTILDDLSKDAVPNPGYFAIGRMKGLAEIRGLELGIVRSCLNK